MDSAVVRNEECLYPSCFEISTSTDSLSFISVCEIDEAVLSHFVSE